jgi:hypothetical protein
VGKLGEELGPEATHLLHVMPGHDFVDEVLLQVHALDTQGRLAGDGCQ